MSRKSWVVIGLAWGDEAKGSCVDYLAREKKAQLVVRFNGGPQAAHNVHLPDGRHHTFSQFGSGTFAGVPTHLSKHMLIEPFAMMNERNALAGKGVDPAGMLTVSPECTIITPWHWKLNQIREIMRGDARHGSCGMGVGEARRDEIETGEPLKVAHLAADTQTVAARLSNLKIRLVGEAGRVYNDTHSSRDRVITLIEEMIHEDRDKLAKYYSNVFNAIIPVADDSKMLQHHDRVVFEGAQGVLLDENFGFAPHNSWTDTTDRNAISLLAGMDFEAKVIGCLRSYYTRHGAGPFPTECEDLSFPDDNATNDWQGAFRFGAFDAVLARYAISVCGRVDYLAISHLDQRTPYNSYIANTYRTRAFKPVSAITDYEPIFSKPVGRGLQMIPFIEEALGVKVAIAASGKTYQDRVELVEV